MCVLIVSRDKINLRHNLREKMEHVEHYLRECEATVPIWGKVRAYYDFYASHISMFDEESILNELSFELRQEVILHNNQVRLYNNWGTYKSHFKHGRMLFPMCLYLWGSRGRLWRTFFLGCCLKCALQMSYSLKRFNINNRCGFSFVEFAC